MLTLPCRGITASSPSFSLTSKIQFQESTLKATRLCGHRASSDIYLAAYTVPGLLIYEAQLRKMSKTLEMLSDASVQRISVSNEMEAWWAEEVSRARGRDVDKKKEKDQVKKTNTQGRDRDQFGGRLPGHGGT